MTISKANPEEKLRVATSVGKATSWIGFSFCIMGIVWIFIPIAGMSAAMKGT